MITLAESLPCSKCTLITTNTKLEKSRKFGRIKVGGVAIAPHRRFPGFNACENAGACAAWCNLWFSGRTVTSGVRQAMLNRSELLVTAPAEFDRQLRAELDSFQASADRNGLECFVRLNVASDLDWSHIVRDYPRISFYDYSKIKSRCWAMARRELPPNYWITPSYHERLHWSTARAWLNRGLNISVVFDTDYCPQHDRIGVLPRTYRGFPVVDGDQHDLRHPRWDGNGNIVGLRFKGSRRLLHEAIRTGFVVET